ncbi:hypothetical protein CEN47_03910 [Fischerella thermalis CCMEE 5319]|nr:hypothetical protein CEN47_03910 [Fischerella thermalis CCMEE 5319]
MTKAGQLPGFFLMMKRKNLLPYLIEKQDYNFYQNNNSAEIPLKKTLIQNKLIQKAKTFCQRS